MQEESLILMRTLGTVVPLIAQLLIHIHNRMQNLASKIEQSLCQIKRINLVVQAQQVN